MKKLLVLILSLVAAITAMLSLAACDDSSNSGGGTTVTDGDKSSDNSGGSQGGSGSETGGGSQGGGSGETPEHTHTYDQEVAEAKYLATEATCEKKATYYYSCACGEKGTETFESGALADHPYNDEWFSDEDNHYRKSTCIHAVVKDKAAHTYNANGVCAVCNRRKPSEGLEYTYNPVKGEYNVSGIGSCTDATVVIPSKYNGKPVTSIGSLKNSAGYLEDKPFEDCTSIESVIIPGTVTRILDYAFYGCSSLSSVVISDGVTYIGDQAFADCHSLSTVILPDSLTYMGDNVFYECNALEGFEDGGLRYFGNESNPYVALISPRFDTLLECKINENCKFICGNHRGGTFADCRNLKSVVIPDSVIGISSGMFINCPAMNYTESENALYLGNEENPYLVLVKAVSTNITSCTINDKCKFVLDEAFKGCNIARVDFPADVISIGDYAFQNCSMLEFVVAGVSLQNIGDHAFENCPVLMGVWDATGLKRIGSNAFDGCNRMSEIALPDGLTEIGSYAFNNCSSLETITIPSGLIKINKSTFSGCSKLTSIVIPDSVTYIGKYAFDACAALTSVNIPDGVTSISDGVFSGCTKLTSVVIPNGVTSIGNCAFYGSGIISIDIPESVESIGEGAFGACISLKNITIPYKVTAIESEMFEDCAALESVQLSTSTIGWRAFWKCKKLAEIHYTGTIEEWENGNKGYEWNLSMYSPCTVKCSDGDIYA